MQRLLFVKGGYMNHDRPITSADVTPFMPASIDYSEAVAPPSFEYYESLNNEKVIRANDAILERRYETYTRSAQALHEATMHGDSADELRLSYDSAKHKLRQTVGRDTLLERREFDQIVSHIIFS